MKKRNAPAKKQDLKLAIWDLDGTIVNSLPLTFNAFNAGLRKHLGRDLTPVEIMKHFGPPERKIIEKLVGQENVDDCYDIVAKTMASTLNEAVIYAGVLETLEGLSSSGLELAILTGRGRQGTHEILKMHKLARYFGQILTGDDTHQPKPHPQGVKEILLRTGYEPEQAVMIGDSIVDVQAGKGAGALAIGCVWDGRTERSYLEEAGADLVASHPSEILKWALGL